MRAQAREVRPPVAVVEDVVVERLDEQPQRGDRRAQVVRDGGDEVVAGRLGARQSLDHRLHLAGQPRHLVVAVERQPHVAPALADRRQPARIACTSPTTRRESSRPAHSPSAAEYAAASTVNSASCEETNISATNRPIAASS